RAPWSARSSGSTDFAFLVFPDDQFPPPLSARISALIDSIGNAKLAASRVPPADDGPSDRPGLSHRGRRRQPRARPRCRPGSIWRVGLWGRRPHTTACTTWYKPAARENDPRRESRLSRRRLRLPYRVFRSLTPCRARSPRSSADHAATVWLAGSL